MRRRALGHILQEMGAISEAQLAEAIEQLKKLPGKRLGEYLISIGAVSQEAVAEALAIQFSLPYVSEEQAQVIEVDPKIANMIGEDYVRRQRVLPLSMSDGELRAAVVDPLNVYALDDLGFVSGASVQAMVVTEATLELLMRRAFPRDDAADGQRPALRAVPKTLQKPRTVHEAEAVVVGVGSASARPMVVPRTPQAGATPGPAASPPRTAEDEAAAVALTDELLRIAVAQGASDVHIEPSAQQLRVRYRIDGVLHLARTLNMSLHAGIVSRIKILSNIDISERRLPQDGRVELEFDGRRVDFRVATMPTVFGEKVVIRILDKSEGIPSLSELGIDPETLENFYAMLRHSHGMILACGPTGSGKTTTMISALARLNQESVNIVTIEDPVEYQLDGVNHMAVNLRAGLDFASGLRALLRQDPDVILIGEIRDGETAEIATRAALTGHLVLSTLHTNDAAGALTRLVDMGVERFLVTASLIGVAAQRLVRRLCPSCKRPAELASDDPLRILLGLPERSYSIYEPVGCDQCSLTGFRGRLAIFELLVLDARLRQMVNDGANPDEIKAAARAAGMRTMLEDGAIKVLNGLTTPQEVLRVAYDA